MMQHIHNSVIHDLERRREDIRQGRQRPPTREDPFEASVPCLPADIRVKVEASRLAQATFDEDLQQSLQEEEDDLEQSAEEEKEQDEKAEPREEGSPSRRAHENEGKGKVSQKKRRKSRTSPHQHLPGVPRRGVPSDEMMWLMMGDNGAGLLDQIELVVAQGSSHGLHCLQVSQKLLDGAHGCVEPRSDAAASQKSCSRTDVLCWLCPSPSGCTSCRNAPCPRSVLRFDAASAE